MNDEKFILKLKQDTFEGQIIQMLNEYKNPSEPYQSDIFLLIEMLRIVFAKLSLVEKTIQELK